MKFTLEFYECEHEGDLANIEADIRNSGGKVLNSRINHEAEIATVQFEFEDKNAFLDKFIKTEAYNFIN